jgi:hypothetical protein
MSWNIRSSSGRENVSVDFIRQHKSKEGDIVYVSEIGITGLFWDRANTFKRDYVNDFSVTLHQIHFLKDVLKRFLEDLRNWLEQPTTISFDLAQGSRDDQRFEIFIGKTEELICSDERPACVIKYISGSFDMGRWRFVLDQSCIRLLAEELSEAIQASIEPKEPKGVNDINF